MSTRDWQAWHAPYDDPGSPLSRRLAIVQGRIRDALDAMPSGPIRVVSICAGQGRDLLGALRDHPRRHHVIARLVELDERNVEVARAAIRAAGLGGIEVVAGDAGATDAYFSAVPADLVLVCGVFGNLTDSDIEHVIRRLPELCARGATVIWTRHRRPPDVTPAIRRWLAQAGFDEIGFDAPEDIVQTVGTARMRGEPRPLEPGVHLFTFAGFDALRA